MTLIFKKSSAQPEFTVGAAISGTVQVGQTLTCTYTATKTRANNVTVRWYSYFDNVGTDEVLIGTGTTYVLTGNELGRYIRAIVTASNPAGSVQSTSSYTAAVTTEVPPDPPTVTSAAAITGTLEVGQTLTVSVTFSGADSVAYQWYSYTSAGGAGASAMGTSTTQALTVAEDGKYIGCQATGTNTSGSTVSTAALVGPIASNAAEAPAVVSAATISLDPGATSYNVGEYIVCDATVSGWTETPTFTWYVCDSDKSNATSIAAYATSPIRPLFKSEPNHWQGAVFLSGDASVNGRYVYCVAAFTNSAGTTPSESAVVGPIGAITGTPLSQANFSSPYKITSAGGQYYLTEDVSANGSAVALLADNITLNLNGKTLTFDNATPTPVPNGDFEEGAASWDWSPCGNAGAGVGNAGDEAYARIRTLESERDAYNRNYAWQGTSGLFFTSAAIQDSGVSRYLESAEITLTSNVWYTASAVFCQIADSNNWPTCWLEIVDSANNVIVRATLNRWFSDHGPQYAEAMFKAVATPATYKVRVGVTGRAIVATGVMVDSVQVSRGHTVGVQVGHIAGGGSYPVYSSITTFVSSSSGSAWLNDDAFYSLPPDISHSTTTNVLGCVIKNGTISQGADAGQWCAAVAVKNFPTNNTKLHRITTSVIGPVGAACRKLDANISKLSAYDSTLACTHRYVGYRDNFQGYTVMGMYGTFERCNVTSYAAGGLSLFTSSQVRGCTIRCKTMQTNCFAIRCGVNTNNATYDIHDNVIDNTGDFYGRGLQFEGNFNGDLGPGGSVYNNTISITQSTWNPTPAYRPYVLQGDYALQVEEVAGLRTLDIYGNTLTANADLASFNYQQNPPRAICYRPSITKTGTTIDFHDNTLVAIGGQDGDAYCYGPANNYNITTVLNRNNACSSNSGFVMVNNDLKAIVEGGTWELTAPAATKNWPVIAMFPDNTPTVDHYYVEFRDVDFGSSAATMAAEKPRSYTTGSSTPGNGLFTDKGSFAIAWTVTFSTGTEGDAVVVKDRTGATYATGTTNVAGVLPVVVAQSTHRTTGITDHNASPGYTVEVNGGAGVPFVADSTKTVDLS